MSVSRTRSLEIKNLGDLPTCLKRIASTSILNTSGSGAEDQKLAGHKGRR